MVRGIELADAVGVMGAARPRLSDGQHRGNNRRPGCVCRWVRGRVSGKKVAGRGRAVRVRRCRDLRSLGAVRYRAVAALPEKSGCVVGRRGWIEVGCKWTKWTEWTQGGPSGEMYRLPHGGGSCCASLLTHAIHAFGKAAFFEKALS